MCWSMRSSNDCVLCVAHRIPIVRALCVLKERKNDSAVRLCEPVRHNNVFFKQIPIMLYSGAAKIPLADDQPFKKIRTQGPTPRAKNPTTTEQHQPNNNNPQPTTPQNTHIYRYKSCQLSELTWVQTTVL